MAILNKKKLKVSSDIPTASTADIAFLLLIFFLVTTQFPKDKGLELVLPEQGVTTGVAAQNLIFFLVQPSGIVQVKRGESTSIQTVQPSDVASIWREEVSANPNLIAAVKTSPDAPYKDMIAVVDGLKQAGCERISLQLLEK